MHFVKDDGIAVMRRQPGQGAPHFLGGLVGQHPGQRTGCLARRLGCLVLVLRERGQGRFAPARRLVLEDQDACDAKQEMLQRAAQRVEGEAPAEQAHEAFLDDVGGSAGHAAAQQCKAVDRPLVAPVQGGKGIGLAGAHPAQQIVVSGGGCDGHVGISHPYSGQAAGKFQLFSGGPACRLSGGPAQSTQFTRSNLLRKSSGMATTWLVL